MENQKEIAIFQLISGLLKKWWIMAAACAVCAMLSFSVSKFLLPPEYTASTRVYILKETDEGKVDLSDVQTSALLLNDYKALVTGRNTAEAVMEALDLSVGSQKLLEKVQVKTMESSRIVQISVTDSDPHTAAAIANCLRDAAADQLREILHGDVVKLVYPAEIPQEPSGPAVMRNTVLAGTLGLATSTAILVFLLILEKRGEQTV